MSASRLPPVFGEHVTVNPASPGLGNPLSYVLPANYDYMMVAAQFAFITGVTAGDRTVNLEFKDSFSATYHRVRSMTVQPDTVTVVWNMALGYVEDYGQPLRTDFRLPLPYMVLSGGSSLYLTGGGFLPVDSYVGIQFVFRRWRQ